MERLEPYMSYDDWTAKGPVNRTMNTSDYDGFARRDPPETPFYPNISGGGPNKVLGNPNHPYDVDSFSASHAQFFHFMNVLEKGDQSALKLVREAAKKGDEVVQFADRVCGSQKAWTMRGPDKETARVLRGFVETALEFYPPAKGVLRQELPKTVGDVDFKAFATAFEKRAVPARWRDRVLEGPGLRLADDESTYHTPAGEKLSKEEAEKRLSARATKQRNQPAREFKPAKYTGVIAMFADSGMAKPAQEWTGRLPARCIVAPMGGELGKDLTGIKRRTQMMANSGKYSSSDQKKKLPPMTKQVIDSADAVAVFWNGDHRSKGAEIIAEAGRAGKIAKILDGEGKEMPIWENTRICMDAHMSRAEAARAKSLDAFNRPISEPYGRMALKMISDEKLGRIGGKDKKDFDRLAQLDGTINDIADMATTDGGRKYLHNEKKISSQTVNLLADDKIMSRARESYLRQFRHLDEHKVKIIGKEDMPDALRVSGQAPNELYIQGDVESFSRATRTVGLVGDGATSGDDVSSRLAASQIAPATSALVSSDATLVYAEGATSMDVPVGSKQMLFIGTGHGHGSEQDIAKRQEILDAGGWVVSPFPPEELRSYFDRAAGERVGIESDGTHSTTNRAASLVGAASEVLVVTDIDRGKTNTPAHVAMRAALEAPAMTADGSIEKDGKVRRPAVLNADALEGVTAMAGNRALTKGVGSAALRRAGFGNEMIETTGKHFDGDDDYAATKVAMDLGQNPKVAISNLIRRLDGEDVNLAPKAKARVQEER